MSSLNDRPKRVVAVDFSLSFHAPTILCAYDFFRNTKVEFFVITSSKSPVKHALRKKNIRIICIENILDMVVELLRFAPKKTDVLLINTLSREGLWRSLFLNFFSWRILVYVRNINELFGPQERFVVTGLISANIKRIVYKPRSSGYVVGTSVMKSELMRYTAKPVLVLPFTNPSLASGFKREACVFCVPGRVDFSRKAIKEVIEAFNEHKQLYRNSELVLLGGCKGSEERRYLANIGSDGVWWWRDNISDSAFSEKICESHVLICCWSENTESAAGYLEEYGVTKDSAVDGHALILGVPVFRRRLGSRQHDADNQCGYDGAAQLKNLMDRVAGKVAIKRGGELSPKKFASAGNVHPYENAKYKFLDNLGEIFEN